MGDLLENWGSTTSSFDGGQESEMPSIPDFLRRPRTEETMQQNTEGQPSMPETQSQSTEIPYEEVRQTEHAELTLEQLVDTIRKLGAKLKPQIETHTKLKARAAAMLNDL